MLLNKISRDDGVQKLIFFSLIILLIFLPFSSAEPVVELDYLLQKDTASIVNIRTYEGSPQMEEKFSDYSLTIEDAENHILKKIYFPAYFVVLDPFAEVEEIPATLTIPYRQDYKTINVFHKEKRIAETDIGFLCMKDFICQQGENAISCPEDCPQSGIDGFCQRKEDNLCDADCLIPEQECRQTEILAVFAWSLPLVFLAGLLVALIIFIIDKIRFHALSASEEKKIRLKEKMKHAIVTAVVFAALALISAVVFFFF